MSALAKYLLHKNFSVSGSDATYSLFVNDLENLGVKVYIGSNETAVTNADVIIVNSAISSDNIELNLAKKLRKPIIDRATLLSEIIKKYNTSIGVAGSHGKTTVTSMIANMFNANKTPFVSHVGGYDYELKNLHYEDNAKYFISEICEYKENVLKTTVTQSVILNADNDHLDCYKNIGNLISAFNQFAKKSKICFYNSDDENLKDITGISFGFNSNADFQAVNLVNNNGKYTFSVKHKGEILSTVSLKVLGKFNVLNALSAFTVGYYNGLSVDNVKIALENFKGVSRRNEFIKKINGVEVYADYCHHPTEISNYITSVLDKFKKPLFIFEPHTYSRTKILFNDFISVFKKVNAVIYKTYPAREKYNALGSALKLANALNKPYFSNFNSLYNYVTNNAYKYDGIFILGAGSLYDKFL